MIEHQIIVFFIVAVFVSTSWSSGRNILQANFGATQMRVYEALMEAVIVISSNNDKYQLHV